jgi:hypothetical protein
VVLDESGAWSCEGLAEYAAYRYLTARFPPQITDNIPYGWRGSANQRQYAYWRKDPGALERMRPALREKLLRGLEQGEAYSVLPARLLEAEKCLGKETVQTRLAEVFRQYRGRTLDRSGFVAVMGPGILELE